MLLHESIAGNQHGVTLTFAQTLDGAIGANTRPGRSCKNHDLIKNNKEEHVRENCNNDLDINKEDHSGVHCYNELTDSIGSHGLNCNNLNKDKCSHINHSKHSQMHISGNQALMLTHSLRQRHQAILVGIGTVLADNPQLTTRYIQDRPLRHPTPIIVDSTLRTPLKCALMARNPIILHCANNPQAETALRGAGARLMRVASKSGRVDLAEGMRTLSKLFDSIMVEGGATIIKEFLENQELHIDRILITVAPRLVGAAVRIPVQFTVDFEIVATYILGNDVVLDMTLKKHKESSFK